MLENCPLQTQLFQSLITYVEDNSRNTLSSNQELSRDSCLCWFWIIIAPIRNVRHWQLLIKQPRS